MYNTAPDVGIRSGRHSVVLPFSFLSTRHDGLMARLHQRRYLKCPYNRARDLLAESIADALQRGDGRLLHLNFAFPAVMSVELGKDVIVSVKPVADPDALRRTVESALGTR